MNFLNLGETVEKPCKDFLAHPVQCLQELFLATPGFVGTFATFLIGVIGIIVAAAIWISIFAALLYGIYFVLKHVWAVGIYASTQTKVGQKIAQFVPIGTYFHNFCCKAQEVQPKKLINTQAFGDYGANIVSKVDTKWFKGAFKNFGSKQAEHQNNQPATPAKSPSKSTSRIAALTPKILSPKVIKQS